MPAPEIKTKAAAAREEQQQEAKQQEGSADVEMETQQTTGSIDEASSTVSGESQPAPSPIKEDEGMAQVNSEAGPSSSSHRSDRRDQLPEDSDPDLIASYPIYLSKSLPESSRLHLLQYPTYPKGRPLPIPESSRQRGLQHNIRWRPNAGWIQIETPVDARPMVYDEDKGESMGKGAQHLGGEFGDPHNPSRDSDEDEGRVGSSGRSKLKKKKKLARYDADSDEETQGSKGVKLERHRLESEVMPNLTQYCVGIMRDHALHLTHLDRIVQLRPSMHHLDGMDAIDAEEKRNSARRGAGGFTTGDEEEAGGDEEGASAAAAAAAKKKKAQSINVSIKDGGAAGGGRGGQGGQGTTQDSKDQLMQSKRAAEGEDWVDLEWRDSQGRHKSEVHGVLSSQLFAGSKTELTCRTRPRDYLP